MEIIKCTICDTEFIPKVFWHKACSKECRRTKDKDYMKKYNDKYYKENREKIFKQQESYKPNRFECLTCDKEFFVARKKAKFCSEKCKWINFSKTRFWKNSHSYVHWMTISKEWRRIYNYKVNTFIKTCKELDERLINEKWYIYCEECWTTNTLRFEHHHLVYRSEKPKHKHLHDIRNIFMCCIKCHNQFHKDKSKRNDIVRERELHLLFWNDILDK